MTGLEELTRCIKKLSADAVNTLLDAVKILLASENAIGIPDCPYCSSTKAIRYGHKCGKQRFLCKQCGRTFVTTTHTIMSQSHFSEAVWQEVISDTVQGSAIDYSAKKLGINHRTVFDMRHKVLLALQGLPETEHVLLDGVSELDETFVLECYKGKPLPETVGRKARKHGAKAQKRGISNEYVCICTGIQRKGDAYAATVNRAKPDAEELTGLFADHIAQGTLVLCDGLKSYLSLPVVTGCTVKDCHDLTEEEKSFFNLNTVNGFHSFIKRRYDFYRGVATKYLNRYNALFAASYNNAAVLVKQMCHALLNVGSADHYHSSRDVQELGLLAV